MHQVYIKHWCILYLWTRKHYIKRQEIIWLTSLTWSLFCFIFNVLLISANQNCSLVIRTNTIIQQDLWLGRLVPSRYKRCKLSNWIFCILRSRDKESVRRFQSLAFDQQYRDDTHYTIYITWSGSPKRLAMFDISYHIYDSTPKLNFVSNL